jgi:hypothetical protein
MGWAWYDAGKKLNKRNAIADYLACARFLIAEGFVNFFSFFFFFPTLHYFFSFFFFPT